MEVSISGQNKQPSETYACILDSLRQLERASCLAFDKMDAATSKRFASISEIESRMEGVKSRIESIANCRKAIKIESSPHYPTKSARYPNVESLFENPYMHWRRDLGSRSSPSEVGDGDLGVTKEIKLYAEKDDDLGACASAGGGASLPTREGMASSEEISAWRLKGEDTRELFHFFASYTNNKYKPSEEELETSARFLKKRYGRVPKNLASVDGMILYGTDRNIYRMRGDDLVQDDTQGSDADDGEDKATSLLTDTLLPNLEIADAPHTMLTTSSKQVSMQAVEFGFRPTLNDVPTLDLPSMLPDLDSIAANVQFQVSQSEGEGMSVKGIAPSANLVSSLPELDDKLIASPEKEKAKATDTAPGTPAIPSTDANSGASQLPPPPPPPPPSTAALPPPPPPPSSAPPSSAAAVDAPKRPPQTDQGGRSALMDAIRKASVVNLKKVEDGGAGAGEGEGGGSKMSLPPAKPKSNAPPKDSHSAMLDAIKGGARQSLMKPRERLPSMKPVQEEEPSDMMSDLKKQLTRRRSTVLGKQQVDRPVHKVSTVQEDEDGEAEADRILGLKEWIEYQESSEESDSDSDSWDD